MRELRPDIWHWQAPHPDWQPTQPWEQDVSSYAIDDGERLLLLDPLALPNDLEELAARRETAIVLTAPWHERDTQRLVATLGVPVLTPRPEAAEDLMQKYGLTAEQAGDGSPDLAWLFRERESHARPYAPGDRPLAGVQAFRAGTRTRSCSGSRINARSSPETRSSTSARVSRSRPYGSGRA